MSFFCLLLWMPQDVSSLMQSHCESAQESTKHELAFFSITLGGTRASRSYRSSMALAVDRDFFDRLPRLLGGDFRQR